MPRMSFIPLLIFPLNAMTKCFGLCLGSMLALGGLAEEPSALRHAHAHNDYEHKGPVSEALAAGFTSVEADVHWIGGEIRVAHSAASSQPGRTLRSLYLEPLRLRMSTHNHRVHPARPEFFLMLDYKAEGEAAVSELHHAVTNELAGFRDLLTRVDNDVVAPGAVTVVLSGSRPDAVIAAEKVRLWAIDGQLPDLNRPAPAHLVPWISTSWRSVFTWNGRGEFPAEQQAELRRLVTQAHAQGRLLRFWGAPDQLNFWRTLHEENVDLLNTDNLEELAAYLRTTPDP